MTIAEKLIRAKTDYDEVYEAGKKSEYDTFWDAFQDNGNRTDYEQAFHNWSSDMLRPKYDIKLKNSCNAIFYGVSGIVDFDKWKADCNITVDFSEATYTPNIFVYSKYESIGRINLSKSSNVSYAFANCPNLKSITEVIINDSAVVSNMFSGSSILEEVRIGGVIGQSGLSLQWATKLSKASITSIINALSTTTTGLTVTLSLDAVKKAFETAEGANDGNTSSTWTTLAATKSNWTIALV